MTPKLSIVIATNKTGPALGHTLASIRRQQVPFLYEVIVVDDGTDGDSVRETCERYGVTCYRLHRDPKTRNPGPARNVGYRLARGELLICQSDEVIHDRPDTIERLARIGPGEFSVAKVFDQAMGDDGQLTGERKLLCGKRNSPYFFLGCLRRSDMFAVGGNDEEFTEPGGEDDFLVDCLVDGLGLRPTWPRKVTGTHQSHPPVLTTPFTRMRKLLLEKRKRGELVASGGPWVYS